MPFLRMEWHATVSLNCQALAAPDGSIAYAGNGNRQTAVTIASVVGAVVGAVLIAGVLGLIFWVRRRRRQESIRDLSDLGALPHVSADRHVKMSISEFSCSVLHSAPLSLLACLLSPLGQQTLIRPRAV